MNTEDLTVNSFISDISESLTLIAETECDKCIGQFFGQFTSLTGTVNEIIRDEANSTLEAHLFLRDVFDYQEEAYNMQALLTAPVDLVGGVSPNPSFPNVVSLDLQEQLRLLQMYTNTLKVLASPAELCVKKALELIGSRADYELNVNVFRMELLNEFAADAGEEEINALVKGICCIAEYLLKHFDLALQTNNYWFPYEFYDLHMGRYLFLTKIVLDANIPNQPAFNPRTVAHPAYTDRQLCESVRAPHSTSTYQLAYF